MAKISRLCELANDKSWCRITYYGGHDPGWQVGYVVMPNMGSMPPDSLWSVVALTSFMSGTEVSVTYDLWFRGAEGKCWLTSDVEENNKLRKLRRAEEASKPKPRRKFRLGQDES